MLASKANWNFIEQEIANVERDNDSLSISPIIEKLLVQRGVTTKQAVSKFLKPDLEDLHSPDKLLSIDKAVKRVKLAIEQGEKLLVFGDYDADGVTATTVLIKALQELGALCDYYIPNRFTEGYGPNEAAFRQAHREGYTLIITVDTGIAAMEEAKIAQELGMDVIITDHHEVQENVPECYAIIHPKCSPDYLFQELAGVGVAFKFAQALLGYLPKQLLSFVAIGTVADLVPLVDENRILVYNGLKELANTTNPGLKALKQTANINGNVTEEDVGFSIGPRLNAVGRLQSADMAVELMLTEDPQEAITIAEEMEEINSERQQIVQKIVKEAERLLSDKEQQDVIVVAKEGWNEGVLGIVASKLVRKWDRPAIVLSIKPNEGIAKGSARSIPAFDLFHNCMQVNHLFEQFGGHSQAAGMTLALTNVQPLELALNKQIAQQLSESDFKQELNIHATLPVSQINIPLIKEIQQLAPFGMHNSKPLFHIKAIPEQSRQIGSMKNHLKLQFTENNQQLDAIGFGFGELYNYLTPHTPVNIVGELSINEWNGSQKPQLMIQDLSIDEWQLFDHRGKRQANLNEFIHSYSSVFSIGDRTRAESLGIPHKDYQDDWSSLENVDTLILFALPSNLKDLEALLKQIKPKNIHLCYYVKDSIYLRAFPSRDDFKKMYIFLQQKKVVSIDKDLPPFAQTNGWSKDKLLFLIHVFYELHFIQIEGRIIQVEEKPLKKDLQESATYQKRLQQAEIERKLYYSNYEQLKKHFTNCMEHLGSPKEEQSYGL
ncbi:single-stranded-DNA-specific exonuclease RecJ [Virgibacillus sp.]|uniref:single-stranded-DNA-specific exonuclease RecJ n=1 Tax=Virgibacillus sp. TaxID=1872700 RepID=UPI0017D9F272|nr:single-stranded-DNA-specific exonuclease RecJ [Virgibacillus sp.]NWO13281.1 single-stranded-DNA-specific exonuclease RecJ [Virgibacillus sp.]